MKVLGSDNKMYSVIDLFAGAGGLSLGFVQTKKYDIKVAFENSRDMQATYKKNHPHVAVCGDVRKADYAEIQAQYGPIDIVIGGPPCQGFSNANRQRNTTISQNNTLVKEYVRAIKELNPLAFVMENVSMLRSDVHRFYLSEDDKELVNNKAVEVKKTRIPLLIQKYYFDGIIEIVKSMTQIKQYLWQEQDYIELNIIYKLSKNEDKLKIALKKHKTKLLQCVQSHMDNGTDNNSPILIADTLAFSAVKEYFDGILPIFELKKEIEAAILYQRMLQHAKEIIDNHLIVEEYSTEGGLYAEIYSFAVLDFIKAMLGQDEDGYSMNYDVLCAADFGAPQKRMRFIMIGVKKRIADSVKLPKGNYSEKTYRTVRDAIADLEDIDPIYDVKEDVGILLETKNDLSELAKSLRDSTTLMNHVITKTTDVAMQRFKALKQGENFHALKSELKTNTYTDATRTQNTIYLRLDYSQPSGTVVNVRKSMWIHPIKNRAISIREAARLQTFPDSFVFTGTKDKEYQQVGNAVPPILAKAIAKELADQLEALPQKSKVQ